MAWAISLWMTKTSDKSRSYFSAQIWVSLRASINCALTRTRLAERCTLPSNTCATFKACAISGSLRFSLFLILHHTGATDHFQVSDFCEVSQNLVLDPVGKKRESFVFTEIFKRQNGDGLGCDVVRYFSFSPGCVTAEEKQRRRNRAANQDNIDPGVRVPLFAKREGISYVRAFDSLPSYFKSPRANRSNRKSGDNQREDQAARPNLELPEKEKPGSRFE